MGAMNVRERLRIAGLYLGSELQLAKKRTPSGEPALEELVEGRWVETDSGRCFVAERLFADDGAYAHGALQPPAGLSEGLWAPFVVGGNGAPLTLARAAFFDTETTGLARGVGTVAFMVGIGMLGPQGFRVRQYLMPDYGDEGALLDLAFGELEGSAGLVSFNGRGFDAPILQARSVVWQRPSDWATLPHLDLLPLARRLWRRALPSCGLAELERSVLKLEREASDVPSHLIPQIYEDYVRWGISRPLAGVFYHNAMDVASMAALAAALGRMLSAPVGDEGVAPCDYTSLGLLYERIGMVDRAVQSYRLATECAHDRRERDVAGRCLAQLLKRQGRTAEAVAVWRSSLGGTCVYPYIELAKQFEHRQRDYGQARQVVVEAMRLLSDGGHEHSSDECSALNDALRRRLARLDARLTRAAG